MKTILQRDCPPGRPRGPMDRGEDFRKRLPNSQRPSQSTVNAIRSGESRFHSGSLVPPIVQEVLDSPGRLLDAPARAAMEPRFGHNFSRVKFRMINGTSQANSPNRLDIVFLPVFTETDPHHTVTVHPGSGTAGLGRADESDWYETDSGITAAHEFGHMLGNLDEYRIPGAIAEIPQTGDFASLTPSERARTSVEGIYGHARPAVPGGYSLPTIMGGSEESPRPTTVELRHVQNIVSWYNANFKPPGEPPYRPVFR